jgi:cyclopropane fatty-acyl-phospholipid synthase-like methyltransferase
MEDYTKEYYQAINKEEEPQAKALAEVLEHIYHPQTVADIGCGTGLYLEPFGLSVQTKNGFELSESAMAEDVRRTPNISKFDLTEEHNTGWRYDLVLCLEVLEHIGSEFADRVVENLAFFGDTLIVTAAPPGQAGLNHVNCQPQEYWNEKFAIQGYKRDYRTEYQIVAHLVKFPHTVWIIRNLMVYQR